MPFNYLGIPLDGHSLRKSNFEKIVSKMTSQISSWTTRKLSYAGRMVLIKHVLSCIFSYWMRIIIFPRGILKKIISVCRNYLWTRNVTGNKNLIAWNQVCKDKSTGGLCIQNFKTKCIHIYMRWTKFFSNRVSISTKNKNVVFVKLKFSRSGLELLVVLVFTRGGAGGF
ncbi:hypothetical protein QQ045_001554 [Rhodiola kirilowii]